MIPPIFGNSPGNIPLGPKALGGLTGNAVIDGPMALQKFMEYMSGASGINNAAGQAMGGLDGASQTVREATKQAMGFLQPYIQGGKEDYSNYRDKVNSGYYNTPFAGVFNPQQAPKQQGYKPTWNQETQSFESNRQPYNPAQMGPIQQQGLPQWTPKPQAQAPAAPAAPVTGGMTPKFNPVDMLKEILGRSRNIRPTPDLKAGLAGNMVNPVTPNGQTPNPFTQNSPTRPFIPNSGQMEADAGKQMTDFISGATKAPWTMTMDDIMRIMKERKPGRTGPYMNTGGMR